jgi:hypothetical protein
VRITLPSLKTDGPRPGTLINESTRRQYMPLGREFLIGFNFGSLSIAISANFRSSWSHCQPCGSGTTIASLSAVYLLRQYCGQRLD